MEATAPGKLMLFGEYAVLEGHSALVTAVDRYATAEYSPSNALRVSAPNVGVYDPDRDVKELPFIEAALQESGEFTGHFIVDTAAFRESGVKLGLGSSAAATVAFVRALRRVEAAPQDPCAVFTTAQNAHRAVQGVGSGADVAASAFGGALSYAWRPQTKGSLNEIDVVTRDGTARIAPVSGGLRQLLTVWSGQAASTTKLVNLINEFKAAQPRDYQRAINALAEAAQEAKSAWSRRDRSTLQTCAIASTEALTTLGTAAGAPLVTSVHRALIDLVGDDGAVKPTGAGGGDLAWVIGDSADQEAIIESRLTDAGYQCLRLTVAPRDVSGPS